MFGPGALTDLGTEPSRPRRILFGLAGPALIVGSVAVAMRGFIFANLLTNQHPDILAFWLPRFCFLGKSLAAGHIPQWNPFLQTGTPYAADPQSGWLNAIVMLLFSTLSCTGALRALIVIQPLLAGLGLFCFLRKEGLHPAAATAGGLSAAMVIASSTIGIALPFAGTLAWTPWVLLGASGYLSAGRLSRKLAWLALGAFAWSQVAGSHMSHGLFICTLLVVVYLTARLAQGVRDGELTSGGALVTGAAFLAFLPAASVAVLLPRLAFTTRSSLAGGYAPLDLITPGVGPTTIADSGVWSGWPLALGVTPGAYAGAAILLAIPAALRNRDKRYLVVALASASAVVYLMTLDLFVGAQWFRSLVLRLPFGDVYLHNPSRLRILLLFTGPALGALGIQGFIERRATLRQAATWVGAGVGLFLLLPLALGAYPKRFVILAVAALATAPLLLSLARGRWWAPVSVAGILTVDLLAGALYSQAYHGGAVYMGLEPHVAWIEAEQVLSPGPLHYPSVDPNLYTSAGPIAQAMAGKGQRFLDWVPPDAYFLKGYLFDQTQYDWPGLFNGRGMLFALSDPTGYNPVQLQRYWSYVRASDPLPLYYNASVLQDPTLSQLRMLGVRYLIVPSGVRAPVAGTPVTTEGGFVLYQVSGWEPMASVVTDWTVASNEQNALSQVTAAGFDPATRAVLGSKPAARPGQVPPGTASYDAVAPGDVHMGVRASAPSLLVVRNAYDTGWHATVDGAPAPVLETDYFLQGVQVPRGTHRVVLTYRDASIFRGLYLSAAVWLLLLAGFAVALAAERRRGMSRTTGSIGWGS